MNLEMLLHDVLGERAGQIPAIDDGWQENRRRIRRARRRGRGAVAGTAVLVAVVGWGLALGTGSTAPGQLDRQVIASGGPSSFVVDGVVVLAGPVKIGSVDYAGRDHAVVAYLKRAPGYGGAETIYLWACTAVADDKGHVTPTMPAGACQGTNQPDAGDFVLEVSPLGQQHGLPVPTCRFGPLGNLDLILVSTRVDRATLRVSDGTTVAMTLVAGTESWPYRLYSGEIPVNRFVGGYRLDGLDGMLQDPPTSDGQKSGCPGGSSG